MATIPNRQKDNDMSWKVYILNTNTENDDQEVHVVNECNHLPSLENQEDLGIHDSCHSAVKEAKRRHPEWSINGCYYCSNACHTG